MTCKINLSTSTEDRKEKEAGSGGQRVKEGSESTLDWEGSAQSGCEQIWGWGLGLRQTWRGCSSQMKGWVQEKRQRETWREKTKQGRDGLGERALSRASWPPDVKGALFPEVSPGPP